MPWGDEPGPPARREPVNWRPWHTIATIAEHFPVGPGSRWWSSEATVRDGITVGLDEESEFVDARDVVVARSAVTPVLDAMNRLARARWGIAQAAWASHIREGLAVP